MFLMVFQTPQSDISLPHWARRTQASLSLTDWRLSHCLCRQGRSSVLLESSWPLITQRRTPHTGGPTHARYCSTTQMNRKIPRFTVLKLWLRGALDAERNCSRHPLTMPSALSPRASSSVRTQRAQDTTWSKLVCGNVALRTVLPAACGPGTMVHTHTLRMHQILAPEQLGRLNGAWPSRPQLRFERGEGEVGVFTQTRSHNGRTFTPYRTLWDQTMTMTMTHSKKSLIY